MMEFKDDDEIMHDSLKEKDLKIAQLEKELGKYKTKSYLINQVNSIVNRSATSDDLYKTLFLYVVEMMDEISKHSSIRVDVIKDYMENLLDNVRVEVFIGEALYGELYGYGKSTLKDLNFNEFYNVSTTKELNIEKILEAANYKNDLVEYSGVRLSKIGLPQYKGGAVWVMEPLLGITPGFIVFLRNGEQEFFTPVEKELIRVMMKIMLPVIYSKILTTRIALEAEFAAKTALIDPLTRMNNRKCFNDDYLDNPRVSSTDYVIMFIDLCKLKHINDTYGHDVADGVLIEVGRHLTKLANKLNGKAYRLGGDEFVVAIPSSTSKTEIKAETQKFQDEWKVIDFTTLNETFNSNVSIGVFSNEFSKTTKNEVVNSADELMYISKNDREKYPIIYNF